MDIDISKLLLLDNPEMMVTNLQISGIISPDDACTIKTMIHKQKVLEVHKSKITRGGGKDSRWFTRVPAAGFPKGKLVKAVNEDALIEKLYEYYFGVERKYETISLKELYPEWLAYKYEVSNRANNARRIDSDFTKYYLNEPLSAELIEKPIRRITPFDIKSWSGRLIKKYGLSRKQFGNIMVPFRQCLDMMVDKELIYTKQV